VGSAAGSPTSEQGPRPVGDGPGRSRLSVTLPRPQAERRLLTAAALGHERLDNCPGRARGRSAVGGWPSRTWSSGLLHPPAAARFPDPATGAGLSEDAWQAGRYQRGEISQRPATPATCSGHANDHPMPPRTPGQIRKLDAVAVLTGPSLPAPSRAGGDSFLERGQRVFRGPGRPAGDSSLPPVRHYRNILLVL
jgi:hypothetical protein